VVELEGSSSQLEEKDGVEALLMDLADKLNVMVRNRKRVLTVVIMEKESVNSKKRRNL